MFVCKCDNVVCPETQSEFAAVDDARLVIHQCTECGAHGLKWDDYHRYQQLPVINKVIYVAFGVKSGAVVNKRTYHNKKLKITK